MEIMRSKTRQIGFSYESMLNYLAYRMLDHPVECYCSECLPYPKEQDDAECDEAEGCPTAASGDAETADG